MQRHIYLPVTVAVIAFVGIANPAASRDATDQPITKAVTDAALDSGSVSASTATHPGHPITRQAFFPLAPGNEWIYDIWSSIRDTIVRRDTIRVDDVSTIGGKEFFHLTTPWFPLFSVWVRLTSNGDSYWCGSPGDSEHPLLLFSAEPETGWLLGGRFCIDSISRVSYPTSVVTPMGSSTHSSASSLGGVRVIVTMPTGMRLLPRILVRLCGR